MWRKTIVIAAKYQAYKCRVQLVWQSYEGLQLYKIRFARKLNQNSGVKMKELQTYIFQQSWHAKIKFAFETLNEILQLKIFR